MPPRTGPANNLADQISWLLHVRPFVPPPPRNEPAANDHTPVNSLSSNPAETRAPTRANASSATRTRPESIAGAVSRQQSRVADPVAGPGRAAEQISDGQGGNISTAGSRLQDMATQKPPASISPKPQTILPKILTGNVKHRHDHTG